MTCLDGSDRVNSWESLDHARYSLDYFRLFLGLNLSITSRREISCTHPQIADLVMQLRESANVPHQLRTADIAQRFQGIRRCSRYRPCRCQRRHEVFQDIRQVVRVELEPLLIRLCMSARVGSETPRASSRMTQTAVRRNRSSPLPCCGRCARAPRTRWENKTGSECSSPSGTPSDEYRMQCKTASRSCLSAVLAKNRHRAYLPLRIRE
jgi:hypothetical protein